MPTEPVWVLYDGTCGVCHGGVSFMVKRDSAAHLRYAPLAGDTHERLLGTRTSDFDSIVVVDRSGHVLDRSKGVLAVLRELDRPWPLAARLLSLVPSGLRNRAYDIFARNRRRFRKAPTSLCPILPPELRDRFAS